MKYFGRDLRSLHYRPFVPRWIWKWALAWAMLYGFFIVVLQLLDALRALRDSL